MTETIRIRSSAGQAAPAPVAQSTMVRKPFRRRLPVLIVVCLAWVVCLGVMAIFGSALAPHDPLQQDLMARNLPPVWESRGTWSHPFGTDQLGQDLLSRVMVSARPSVLIGVTAAGIALVIGTLLGLIAGYVGGVVDALIMLLADTQLSTPFLVIAIAVVAAFGQSILILIVLAGISGWMGFARTVRAQVLSLRRREFVLTSQALGASNSAVLWRHILPNLSSTIIVLITIQFRDLILFEASLSFLGLGVPPPNPSWGSMINAGRDYLLTAWWISTIPGIALMLTVLAVSLIGDWLRDALDPTLRGIR